MRVISQDKDVFTFKKKSQLYTKDAYSPDTFIYLGCNVMGTTKKLFKAPEEEVLGTFDDKADAEQVLREMVIFMDTGAKSYTVPEPAMDLEDLYELEAD